MGLFAYDFITLDFETASSQYHSACSVGLAAVKNNEIVDTFYSLIKPRKAKFSQRNTDIHGITYEMVKDAPSLDEVWECDLKKFFGVSLVIVHSNNYFDISVLQQSMDHKLPRFTYVNSMSLVGGFVSGKRSLENCASELKIDTRCLHNALDDAITCARIVIKCVELSGLPSASHLCFSKENLVFKYTDDLVKSSSPRTAYSSGSSGPAYNLVNANTIKAETTEFNKAHPLYGKNIVITGNLSIPRETAMQIIANVGAIPKNDISQKIDFLVVGEKDPAFCDADGLSSKERKAHKIIDDGKGHIKIISDTEFMDMLNWKEDI